MEGTGYRTTHSRCAGSSAIEMAIVVTISLILAGITVPLIQQTLNRYQLRAAVSAVTGAVQTTRYRALMQGYPHRLTISPADRTYQVSSQAPPATTFSNVGSAVPISGSPVAIAADTTWEFRPNGSVAAPVGAMNLAISYKGMTQTITVSTYGNVTVTP